MSGELDDDGFMCCMKCGLRWDPATWPDECCDRHDDECPVCALRVVTERAASLHTESEQRDEAVGRVGRLNKAFAGIIRSLGYDPESARPNYPLTTTDFDRCQGFNISPVDRCFGGIEGIWKDSKIVRVTRIDEDKRGPGARSFLRVEYIVPARKLL